MLADIQQLGGLNEKWANSLCPPPVMAPPLRSRPSSTTAWSVLSLGAPKISYCVQGVTGVQHSGCPVTCSIRPSKGLWAPAPLFKNANSPLGQELASRALLSMTL